MDIEEIVDRAMNIYLSHPDLMSWWQENNYGTIDTYLNERLLISPQCAELLRQICLEL